MTKLSSHNNPQFVKIAGTYDSVDEYLRKKAAEELTLYSDPQSQMEYLKKVLRHLEENLKTVRDPNHRKWLERKRYETMATLRDLEVQKPIYEWKDYAKEIVKLQEELKKAKDRLSKWEKGELSPAEVEDLKAQEREDMMPMRHILESDVHGLEEQIAEYQRSPEEIASYEKYYKEQEEEGAKYDATPPNPHPDEAEWTPEGTLRYYEQPEEPEKKLPQLPQEALKLSQRVSELSKRAYTLQENRLNPQLHGPDNEITPYAAADELMKPETASLLTEDELRWWGTDMADDEPNKYEREKDDPKWKKVLLSDGKDWTREAIRNHYKSNADKILKEIKGYPVMIYVGTDKNKNILKRHHNDKPIVINNKEELMYWADRRLLSLHRVFGPKTKLGFVDLDVHGDVPDATVQKYAREIASKVKTQYGPATIYDSGGSGYHIEFHLKSEKDTDALRNELHDMCEELNEKYDGFTTGIVKGKGVRTDTTTLKNNGNIRVPYALHESKGGVKKPLGAKKKAAISKLAEKKLFSIRKKFKKGGQTIIHFDWLGEGKDFFELNEATGFNPATATLSQVDGPLWTSIVWIAGRPRSLTPKETMLALSLCEDLDKKASLSRRANDLVVLKKDLEQNNTFKEINNVLMKYRSQPGFNALIQPTQIDNSLYFGVRVEADLIEKISRDLINNAGFKLRPDNSIEKEDEHYRYNAYISDDPEGQWVRVSDNPNPSEAFEKRTEEDPDWMPSGYNLKFIISKKQKKALSKNDIVKLAWGVSTDEVKKIYELEYKLYMLSQRKELGDNAYLLKHKYENELNRLLDHAMIEFDKSIDRWVDSHEYAVKNYEMTPNHKQQIFDYWDKMVDLQDELRRPPKNLKGKIVLFHKALNTAHMTGRMADYFVSFPAGEEYEFKLINNPTDILDELSAGKQVPQWESEISRIAAEVKTMYGIGEDLKDHLYKLPANDRGFLDADNNTFVGMIGDIKNKQYIRWVFSFMPRDFAVKENTYISYITTTSGSDVKDIWGDENKNPYELLEQLKKNLENVRIDKLLLEINREKPQDRDLGKVIPFPKLSEADEIQLIKEGKSDKAGIFIVLPKKLGKQFPSLGDFDSSKSHVTVLFIGKVPKKHYELLEETVKKVAKKYLPFILQLDEKVSYFPATKHSEGRKIAKMKVISETLHQLHKDLKKAILAAGIEIDDHFPNYKPHVTLEYMPIAKQKYDDTAPDGSWVAEAMEIWGLGDPIKIPFEKVLSKRAARIDFPRKMFEEITGWIKANSDLLKRRLLIFPGEKSLTKTFNIDISDTEQYRKHDWIPKMLSLEQSNNKHKTLAIRLIKSGPSGTEGTHMDVDGIHVIHLFHALDALKSGEIYITLKHELIHMMQALMSRLVLARTFFTEKPYRYKYQGRAGIPGKYNPKTYKMYVDPEEDILSDEELTKRHAMSDVEFFTRLNDDIEYLKRKLNTVEKNKKKDVLEAFVNKSTFLNFLKTFDYDKFKRAVREIYRAFDEIIATASLSKRSAQGVDLDDLRQIYEMEYKLFKLNQRPYLSDPAYMLKNKFNTKLHMLLNEIFPVFANVYGEWIDYELNLMLNANPKDLIKKEKYQQMMADLPGEHLKRALEDAKEKEIYNIWLTEQPYKGIKAVYDQLGAHRVDPNNLNPSIVLFHTALNTAHFTGKMIEHLARAFSNAKPHKIMTMLDQLSAGIDTAKWDRELTRIASGNISKRAGKSKIPQCEICGQKERELLEQVVVSFGDYSYRCNKHLLPYEASTEDINIKPVCTAMDCFEPQVKDDEGSWLTDLCVKHYTEQKQKIQQREQERERQLQSLLPRNCDRCQKPITSIDDLFKMEINLPGETKILYQCWKCRNDEWNRTQDISKKKAYLSKRADVLFKTPSLPTGYNAQVAAFRDFKPEDLKIEGSTFNPSIAPGQYRVYKDKPINAIWTSTLKGSTTDWLNWNRNFSMFRDYSNQQAPLFDVSGAKVYHINSNDDYAKLREIFPRTTIMTYGSYKDEIVAGVDWDKFAKQYDAVHLADPSLGKDDYEKGIKGNRDLDWDVESTAWFNPQVLKLIDIGQIQPLTPEERESPEWKRKLSSKNPLEDIIVPSSDIHIGGKDKPREQLIHTMEEAEKMATEHPSAFISLLRPSNKFAQDYEKFKVLEPLAIENLALKEPIVYFMEQYHKKNKGHNRIAAEMLLKSHAPSMYFTMGLFADEEFKHLIPQAMEAVAEKDPKFLNELLGLEKFKEFSPKLSKRASGLGLLIDPRGKIYDVGFQGHDEFAARMLQGELTDLNFNYELPPTDFLIANGWIRVGSFKQMMSVGVGVFDDKVLRMLQNAASDLPKFKSVFVSAYLSGENKNIPYDDFMSADHANQLKVFDMRRASLSKRAGSIDVPKKMLNEIYTWMMPLRAKMAAAYKKKYSDRQLSNLDLAFRMIIGGGQGSVRDLAKRLKIDTSRLDLNKTVDFFQGIDEIRNGMIERKSPGFFDKLRDGSLLKDARDNSDPNDDYKSLNIDINNSNVDFRLRVQDDTIKGVPYHCWPTIYKIVGYSSGGVYTQEDSCDPDLMYQVFEFSFNRINKKLEVYIFDEAFLRQELQRFKEWTEIIIGKAKAGALEKDLPDGFEFDFERPKLKKTVAGGWLIKNNIQFYQNFLTSVSVMIHSLENYLRAIRKNKQEEIIEDHDLEITKSFKTDVSDIKQYAEFKKEIDELLTESTFSNLFSNLKVTLEIGEDAKAWFNAAAHESPQIYIKENGNELRSKDSLIQDLSHELIHFVQDLLTHAIKKRNKYLQYKNWEAGMPGKYDPKSYKFYTSDYEKDPEYQKQHALSDVEFYTRFEDAVGNMREFVREERPTVSDFEYVGPQNPDKPLDSIYKLDRAKRLNIMRERFKYYLKYDDTLRYLRQYSPEKFNKMVRELYREFDNITKTASISKRADKLKEYKKKREFKKTPEPEGKISKRETQKFVIHKHDADRAGLHFDLRLEHEGVLESWAIKKHKLPAKGERLLAMRTEDHPLEYGKFKGTIPEGEYGAGKVDIYDSGTYETIKRTKDTIKFKLNGKKEKGSYTLHRTDGKSWILMVMKDDDNKD